METRTLIEDVNIKTARAMVAVQEYVQAAAKVAEAVKASLEEVAKWAQK